MAAFRGSVTEIAGIYVPLVVDVDRAEYVFHFIVHSIRNNGATDASNLEE
jgi:hypothetical protein